MSNVTHVLNHIFSGGGRSAEEINSVIPIRRQGNRREIGEICLFLATDMAGLITSSTIIADGALWLASGQEEITLEFYRKFLARM